MALDSSAMLNFKFVLPRREQYVRGLADKNMRQEYLVTGLIGYIKYLDFCYHTQDLIFLSKPFYQSEMSKQLRLIKGYASEKELPFIPIDAKDVLVITEPASFYKVILDNVNSTKRRLALSALYLGTGPKEKAIIEAIHDNIDWNNNLKVKVVLDNNRARRTDDHGQSSLSVLRKLLAFENVSLDLVETSRNDTVIYKYLRRFQKWNEISSTYHGKMLVFDDEVLVTGANLSDTYFERRKDRYMLIGNSRLLSDYIFNLLECIGQDQDSIRIALRNHNYNHIKQYLWTADDKSSKKASDTYIIPLCQHGPSGLTDKEEFLKFLDSILPSDAQIYLSSGYFNPSPIISSLRISSVLAPSERANGFYGGSGFLNYVPRLYTALHKLYLDTNRRCKLLLYDKPDWSFHAKGVWIEGLDDLYIHIIGSSNFNYRSSVRDFETQLVLLTTNKDLSTELRDERVALWEDSSRQLSRHNIEGLNPIYNTLARILKTFL